MIELIIRAETAEDLILKLGIVYKDFITQLPAGTSQLGLDLNPPPAPAPAPEKPAKAAKPKIEKASATVEPKASEEPPKQSAPGVDYETLKQLAAKLLVNPAVRKEATKIVRAAAGSSFLTDVPTTAYDSVYASLLKLEASLGE